jgi:hypothetical protein
MKGALYDQNELLKTGMMVWVGIERHRWFMLNHSP